MTETQQERAAPSTAIAVPAKPAPDPELDRLARIGTWLAASEAGGQDEKSRGMTAALRLYYAAQLGLPPLASSELSVIKGRLFLSSKLLRGLAAQQGYRVVRMEGSNEKSCTAILYDRATMQELGRATFTIEDAQRAKLLRNGSAWESHPSRMLWHRAAKYVLDDYAPEVTLGLADTDEVAEYDDTPSPPAPPADDGDWEPVKPEPFIVETEDERRTRLHRQLAVLCHQAETDSKALLPQGQESWETYSRFLAKATFGVDSRADLSADQLAELVKLVEEQVIPF